MAIQRRITSNKPDLFGGLEKPPVGYNGAGFSFSLADYEEEAARRLKKGGKPVEVHRALAHEVGHEAWTENLILDDPNKGYRHWTPMMRIVYLPKGVSLPHPMTKDREYAFTKHDKIICGWVFDRLLARQPQTTLGAWVATRVGYISHGQPLANCRNVAPFGAPPDIRYGFQRLEPPRCIGINPYRDFDYIGEFTRRLSDYPSYLEEAVAAVQKKFIRLHGAK